MDLVHPTHSNLQLWCIFGALLLNIWEHLYWGAWGEARAMLLVDVGMEATG